MMSPKSIIRISWLERIVEQHVWQIEVVVDQCLAEME